MILNSEEIEVSRALREKLEEKKNFDVMLNSRG